MFHSKCERNLDMLNTEVKRLGEQSDAYKSLLNSTLDLLVSYYRETVPAPSCYANRDTISYIVTSEIEIRKVAKKRAEEDARIELVVKDVLQKNKIVKETQ